MDKDMKEENVMKCSCITKYDFTLTDEELLALSEALGYAECWLIDVERDRLKNKKAKEAKEARCAIEEYRRINDKIYLMLVALKGELHDR